MGFFDYFTPPTSPIPGPNQSQFGKDFSSAVESGAHQLGNLASRALLNFGNFASGGKLAQQQPQAFAQQPQPTAKPSPLPTAMPVQTQPTQPQTSPWGNALSQATKMFQRPSPTPLPTAIPTATPTPTQPMANGLTAQDYQDIINQGLQNWGGKQLPVSQYAQQFAQLPFQYDMYQKVPYLLPAISILETGGGVKNNPNNPFNWGIAAGFHPENVQTAIERAASGIAQRYNNYAPFRGGNLQGFGEVYAPLSDNPGTGGPYYDANLQKIFDIFNQAEQQVRSRKNKK